MKKENNAAQFLDEADILARLMDEEDNDPIVLADHSGTEYEFEQIAVIPHKENIYAILRLANDTAHILDEDEGMVFRVEIDEDTSQSTLVREVNPTVADEVFDVYLDLLENEWGCGCGCEHDCDCDDDCDCDNDCDCDCHGDCDDDCDCHGDCDDDCDCE